MNSFTFKTISRSIAVLLALTCWLFTGAVLAEGPSFDCVKVEAGSIEEMVCKDKGLAALDRKLAEVYSAASQKAVNEHPPVLKAEQRGWIKGRNDCWKSADRRKCRGQLSPSYRRAAGEVSPGSGQWPHHVCLRWRSEKRGCRHLFPDRSADADRRARRPGVADVPSAEWQRRQIPGPERVPVGTSR